MGHGQGTDHGVHGRVPPAIGATGAPKQTYMVLLPKKPGATSVDAFRPICLQNCSLKILAKVLTSRLQSEIPMLIDLNQTGFPRDVL